jgi:hypothetical protein
MVWKRRQFVFDQQRNQDKEDFLQYCCAWGVLMEFRLMLLHFIVLSFGKSSGTWKKVVLVLANGFYQKVIWFVCWG